MALQLPPCPASLRPIQHYLKTASEHDGRDPVVSYWCRLYALQTALKIDKKSDEAKLLLVSLMDWLERQKKIMADNEAITNDIAAQAHIENYALKLFIWADSQDRASVFNKNVVKAFYTSGFLMDVLSILGEVSEEVAANCKYAKWKAAYIHNCLKNGEMPVPGPQGGIPDDELEGGSSAGASGFDEPATSSSGAYPSPSGPSNTFPSVPTPTSHAFPSVPNPTGHHTFPSVPTPSSHSLPSVPTVSNDMFPAVPTIPSNNMFPSVPTSSNNAFPSVPAPTPYSTPTVTPGVNPLASSLSENSGAHGIGSGIKLDPSQMTKAQKYCKWASSALNYDDIPEAVSNLQKALKLLQTGIDS